MRALAPVVVTLLFVVSLSGCVRRVAVPPPSAGQEVLPLPPAGMVELNIVSEDERQVWDVSVGGQVVCATPCAQLVDEWDGLELRMRSRRHQEVYVGGLAAAAPGVRRAFVVAEGTHQGKKVNGIVFTTLGGMGMVIGITFTAVGCSNVEERGGMCTGGLITGGITTALTAAALWMLIDSAPKAHLLPVFTSEPAPGQVPVTVAVTPMGVAGTF